MNSKMTKQQVTNHMELIMREIENLPKDNRKHAALTEVKKIFGAYLPESLLELTSGLFLDGDSGININEKPSWLDMEKFRKGQKFYQDHYFSIAYNEMLGLYPLLSFDSGLNPFIFTGGSSTPFTSFKRYLSSHFRFANWYTSDPWTCGTPAYNDMKYTRQKHKMVRKSVSNASEETYEKKLKLNPVWSISTEVIQQDFKSACSKDMSPAQCPYVVLNYFSNKSIQHVSQTAMSVTQFGFCGLIVYKPELFGIHNTTDEDLEAFCHLWRGFGYLLGIDDEYNFCRGTLADVRTRSKDILEYWIKPNFRDISPEWEHMMRCLAESIWYFYPIANFECVLLHMAEIMDVPLPRLVATLPYHIKILHYLFRFYFHYGSRIPGVPQLMNYSLSRAILKAKNFDKEKLKQLQIKSEKTLNSIEKSAQLNTSGLLVIKLFVIIVIVVCAIMLC